MCFLLSFLSFLYLFFLFFGGRGPSCFFYLFFVLFICVFLCVSYSTLFLLSGFISILSCIFPFDFNYHCFALFKLVFLVFIYLHRPFPLFSFPVLCILIPFLFSSHFLYFLHIDLFLNYGFHPFPPYVPLPPTSPPILFSS